MEGSKFGDDEYNTLSLGVPQAEHKQEEFARVLKALMAITSEEKTPREESDYCEDLSGNFTNPHAFRAVYCRKHDI